MMLLFGSGHNGEFPVAGIVFSWYDEKAFLQIRAFVADRSAGKRLKSLLASNFIEYLSLNC
jgi:hypothetical protein